MKGLDTAVLLGILHGSPSVRPLLKSLAGEELSTTELNMVELALIAGAGGTRARKGRLQALERLRRRITVLPIDHHATEVISQRGVDARSAPELHFRVMLATLEAAGCTEVMTDHRLAAVRRPGKLKVTGVTVK